MAKTPLKFDQKIDPIPKSNVRANHEKIIPKKEPSLKVPYKQNNLSATFIYFLNITKTISMRI